MDNIQNYSSKKEDSNSLSVEQLLMPRYMVIADYPGSKYPVGFIIVLDGSALWVKEHKEFHDKYPHLFRAMLWYEGRKVEDMPEYLVRKHAKDKTVFKAEKHFVSAAHGDGFLTTDYTAKSYCNYLPATEAEYISHINKTK